MLTNSQIKEFVSILFDCREKLLWLTSQEPLSDAEREFIENAKQLLIKTNLFLEDFNVQLPT